MATALPGWHPGELSIQQKLGFADSVKENWRNVRNFMPEQHRIFHTSNLPFIPVTTVDDEGCPWAAIVAGTTGEVGFVQSPDPQTLSVNARLWDGDPLLDTARRLAGLGGKIKEVPDRLLVAGLGIEFSTRRRNKFAGLIKDVRNLNNLDYRIDLNITETMGYVHVFQAFLIRLSLTTHPGIAQSTLISAHWFLIPIQSHQLPIKALKCPLPNGCRRKSFNSFSRRTRYSSGQDPSQQSHPREGSLLMRA